MSQNAWTLIKRSKGFYIKTYRAVGRALLISIIINFIVVVAIVYVYATQPQNDFYATSGITSPVTLMPIEQPNNTSTPLLPADPQDDMGQKLIPQ